MPDTGIDKDTRLFYIELTATIKYGWYGKEADYVGLLDAFGVKSTKPGDEPVKGLVIGADKKPPVVRMKTTKGKTINRFISPEKLKTAVYDEGAIGLDMKDNGKVAFISVKSN